MKYREPMHYMLSTRTLFTTFEVVKTTLILIYLRNTNLYMTSHNREFQYELNSQFYKMERYNYLSIFVIEKK
jgi:hypothetical protein